MRKIIDVAVHFWSKVAKTDACWLWTGRQFWDGYGAFDRRIDGVKKIFKAHRQSYELSVGAIPDGLHVLHRCDVRLCVRPDHLFLGTNDDNVADRTAKGRSSSHEGELRDGRGRWIGPPASS